MVRSPNFCGLILAAGESSRMGRDKALLPWPPAEPDAQAGTNTQTFLSSAIQSLSPFVEIVIVVTGNNYESVAPLAYANGAKVVRNPEPEQGQFSSLKIGLQQVLNYGRDAAMITLVDRPPANSSALEKLTTAFLNSPTDIWAVIPEYQGRHGHPILFGREMIEVLLKAPLSANARDVEHQNQQHIRYATVDDPAVTLNVNTPEEYAALKSATLQTK
jgi:CTP:molybdopterin cytidylyltransferase MocA